MRPPRFWTNPPDSPGWQARLLAPLAALYAATTESRIAAPKFDPGPPVVSVGNLNVGGTGKTPVVMDLIARLGPDTHVVSRGYGGSEIGPLRVKEREHSADQVGDEPLLLSAFAPTWIAKDRPRGLQKAARAGARVIVLDDGHQTKGVARALSILVVDAETGFGNERVLPAGPLRETVSRGLHRTHLMVLIGPPEARARFLSQWGDRLTMPVVEGALEVLETGMDWAGLPVLAFAGIGRPEKFFDTLHTLGAEVLRAEPLDDHQSLSDALMKRLELEAAALGAQLVTTEKDAVRLPASFRPKVLTLPVRLKLEDAAPLERVIRERV